MAGEKVTTFKIYVGNIPEGATTEDIRQIFEEFGTVVECDCLGNRAFVHMEDDIEGKHAVGQLQDIELQGSKLKILESKNNIPPKTPIVKLLVKNVGSSVDARGLRNMFKRFGFVLEVELSNGVGHVCLEATGDIGSAIKEMNGKVIDDVALTVEPAPITTSTAPSPVTESDTSPAKKKFKSPNKYNGDNNSRSYNNYSDQSQWSTPSDYEAEAEWYGDEFINYSEPYVRDPYFPPPQQHFHTPERILRDPYAQQQQNAHFSRGSPRFRGPRPMAMGARGPHPVPMGARGPRPVSMGARGPRPMAMGVRGPRPVAMGPRGPRPMAVGGRGPPPLLFHRPPQGPPMMGGRVPLMRPRMPSHGHFPTPFGGHSQADNSFYTRSTEVVARNGPPPEIDRYQGQAEVFYEDEPLPSIPSRPPPRMNISDANMIPVGGSGMAYQGPTFARRGRGQPGQRGGGGRGRGREHL
ncbi:unnamed protein product [Orchesella dallaii]|uniref:RRM domain-containing protein n=1 Tax=Orchesella dallaii TaxID=48710 RepID=A0ABP1Q100_9HEXA